MQGKARKKQLFTLGTIVIVAAVASIAAGQMLAVVRVAENWSQDLRVATLTPAQPQSDQIVIVTITEDTLAGFPYRSPLDRRFLSELLRVLEEKGAKLIGVDVLLDQPSEASKDSELKETFHTLSVPIVVVSAQVSDGLSDRQAAFMASYLNGIRTGAPMISVDSIDGTVRSIILRRQSEGRPQLGFVATIADELGVRVPAERFADITLPRHARYEYAALCELSGARRIPVAQRMVR